MLLFFIRFPMISLNSSWLISPSFDVSTVSISCCQMNCSSSSLPKFDELKTYFSSSILIDPSLSKSNILNALFKFSFVRSACELDAATMNSPKLILPLPSWSILCINSYQSTVAVSPPYTSSNALYSSSFERVPMFSLSIF